MSNLNEVLAFIKNADSNEINSIIDQINIRRSELRFSQKLEFTVGDTVKINHKSAIGKQFRIEKIMTKNIRVKEIGGNSLIRVSPSLLEKL